MKVIFPDKKIMEDKWQNIQETSTAYRLPVLQRIDNGYDMDKPYKDKEGIYAAFFDDDDIYLYKVKDGMAEFLLTEEQLSDFILSRREAQEVLELILIQHTIAQPFPY